MNDKEKKRKMDKYMIVDNCDGCKYLKFISGKSDERKPCCEDNDYEKIDSTNTRPEWCPLPFLDKRIQVTLVCPSIEKFKEVLELLNEKVLFAGISFFTPSPKRDEEVTIWVPFGTFKGVTGAKYLLKNYIDIEK